MSIDVVLDEASLNSRHDGRRAMEIIFDLAKTMARQELAFRGHELEDGNFYQLLQKSDSKHFCVFLKE